MTESLAKLLIYQLRYELLPNIEYQGLDYLYITWSRLISLFKTHMEYFLWYVINSRNFVPPEGGVVIDW